MGTDCDRLLQIVKKCASIECLAFLFLFCYAENSINNTDLIRENPEIDNYLKSLPARTGLSTNEEE